MVTSSNELSREDDVWTLWPVMYLAEDLKCPTYDCFGLGTKLIRAGKDVLVEMRELAEINPYCFSLENYVGYVLAIRLPHATEHVPITKLGMDFVERVQEAIVNTFLTCLRLVKPTRAICPTSFKGTIHADSIVPDSVRENTDYGDAQLREPSGEVEEDLFTDVDMDLLLNVWKAMVSLRGLDHWVNEVFTESFFARLDQEATTRAKKEVDSLLKGMPPEVREMIPNLLVEDRWREFHSPIFRSVFSEKEEERFLMRTRIGRALGLFDQALNLPALHGFLSMCIVLETLFTIGRGEVTHKLGTRLARICASSGNLKARRDYYERVKKVYNERSNVVHGEKSIRAVDSNIRKDAYFLARRSLQTILLDKGLLVLYSAPGTSDKRKRKQERELRDFFVDLDLEERGPHDG